MYKIRRSMYTETAHMLKGHLGLCQYYHGHSYKWTVEIGAEELQKDMVIDFTDLKDLMNAVIGIYDHALVVDKHTWETQIKNKVMDTSRVVQLPKRPTAEVMAEHIFQQLKIMLPKTWTLLRVVCRETENNEAEYCETNLL